MTPKQHKRRKAHARNRYRDAYKKRWLRMRAWWKRIKREAGDSVVIGFEFNDK